MVCVDALAPAHVAWPWWAPRGLRCVVESLSRTAVESSISCQPLSATSSNAICPGAGAAAGCLWLGRWVGIVHGEVYFERTFYRVKVAEPLGISRLYASIVQCNQHDACQQSNDGHDYQQLNQCEAKSNSPFFVSIYAHSCNQFSTTASRLSAHSRRPGGR